MRPSFALRGIGAIAVIVVSVANGVEDVDFRSRSRGADEVEITGEAFRRDEVAPNSPESYRGSSNSDDTYYCKPVLYTYGIYSVMAKNCRGELGGTELTPWYEEDEAEEGESVSEPPQAIVVTREDVQSLLVEAGGLEVQPDRSWVLVHAETIAFSGAEQQILTTSVLGAPVEVRAIPEQFTWDFGDGSAPLVTADPGAPWPDHTVVHTYAAAQEGAQISVTTEWDAAFRIVGMTAWLPVNGAVVTSESSASFDVVTATPRLVAAGS